MCCHLLSMYIELIEDCYPIFTEPEETLYLVVVGGIPLLSCLCSLGEVFGIRMKGVCILMMVVLQ